MKKLLLLTMVAALLAYPAIAAEKPTLEKPVRALVGEKAVFTHDEWGNLCSEEAEFNIIAPDGNDYEGDLTDSADQDWYELFIPADGFYTLELGPGADPTTDDPQLYVYEGDCAGDALTEIAYDDDGGVGFFSLIAGLELQASGDYYVKVNRYSFADPGSYTLVVTEDAPPPPPPANDLCEDAEIIPFGAYSIDGDLTGATGDYTTVSGGCTGYAANGKDLVYTICLKDGDTFDVVMTEVGFDASIYLVLDCADIAGSCVAGGDDPEEFTYTNTSGFDEQLYLIVDAFSAGAGGLYNIAGNNGGNCLPVATEETSWGSLKSMFR
jgi:hypothetical protein